jgi:hypothetical protein
MEQSLDRYDTLLATDLIESDIDALLRMEEYDDFERRLSFKKYGKSETEWRLFRRILFKSRAEESDNEPKRTNYVQCRSCGKILMAKLTGGSNPAYVLIGIIC